MYIQTRRNRLALLHLTLLLHEKESFVPRPATTTITPPSYPSYHHLKALNISHAPNKQESQMQRCWIVAQEWSLQFDKLMTHQNKIYPRPQQVETEPCSHWEQLRKVFLYPHFHYSGKRGKIEKLSNRKSKNNRERNLW